jgi:hypothetical protein
MPRQRVNLIATALLLLAVANALLFWIRTLGQPLIDAFSFRQTQTALTAFWLQPGLSWILHYETPVLGAPWEVPFEFPFYQFIVAALSRIAWLDLSFSGRVVSLIFGLGAMAMAIALLRQYGFSRLAQLIFATLYLSSSIYLYWNRSFMIESTALFFILTALFFYGRSLRTYNDLTPLRMLLPAAGFALSLTLAMLVKATTALSAFLLISCHLLWHLLRRITRRSPILLANSLALLAGVAIAFFALREWTHHADALKSLNPYGLKLTSTALRDWNFGNLRQRFSGDLWQGVLIKRMMTKDAWLPLVLLLATALWQSRKDRRRLGCILVCILLGVMPLLLFSNLHIVHNYYQSANHIFLLLAIAGSGALILERPRQPALIQAMAAAILLFYVISDGRIFKNDYLDYANKQSDEKLEISRLINTSTDPSSAILILGDDWDSSFPYLSRRRALVLPRWYEKGPFSEQGVLSDPSARLKPYRLGAIVTDKPLSTDTLARICPTAQQVAPVVKGRWNLYVCSTGPKA